jgi:hypothetical protein
MKECKILTCENIYASRCPVKAGGAGAQELLEHPALEKAVNAYLAHGWELAQISQQGGNLTIALLRETDGFSETTQTQQGAQATYGAVVPGRGY